MFSPQTRSSNAISHHHLALSFNNPSKATANLLKHNATEASIRQLAMWQCNTEDNARSAIESFVAQIFLKRHDAVLSSFMPQLWADGLDSSSISCAVGLRPVKDTPLFLEQYLEEPIDYILSKMTDDNVCRNNIVEIGNLASSSAGNSRKLFIFLVHYLAQHIKLNIEQRSKSTYIDYVFKQ